MVHLLLAVIYLAFISLGLPDSLLGAAWPSMQAQLGVPVSSAGVISTIIALGTVVSSLQSDRLTRKLGAGLVTALSVLLTALALLGFSLSRSFLALCILAFPYGLGAGSVDAALNNYVALNYASRHMSWLHCMWGVGTTVGPYVMEYALTGGQGWNAGYRYIAILQFAITLAVFLSLPLWKKRAAQTRAEDAAADVGRALSLKEIVRIPGAKDVMAAFFCYCAVEATTMLWASSYLALARGVSAEAAAGYASLFFIGITVGRALNGFLTMRFSDAQMIRAGQALVALGALLLLLPLGTGAALAGLVVIGLGCAPIYPCIIHSTPERFGAEKSQALIGVQMASAYVGTLLMPPVFGLIAGHISIGLFPAFLLVALAVMVLMHERLVRKTRTKA